MPQPASSKEPSSFCWILFPVSLNHLVAETNCVHPVCQHGQLATRTSLRDDRFSSIHQDLRSLVELGNAQCHRNLNSLPGAVHRLGSSPPDDAWNSFRGTCSAPTSQPWSTARRVENTCERPWGVADHGVPSFLFSSGIR